jgi:hypothetical protein
VRVSSHPCELIIKESFPERNSSRISTHGNFSYVSRIRPRTWWDSFRVCDCRRTSSRLTPAEKSLEQFFQYRKPKIKPGTLLSNREGPVNLRRVMTSAFPESRSNEELSMYLEEQTPATGYAVRNESFPSRLGTGSFHRLWLWLWGWGFLKRSKEPSSDYIH